MTEVDSLLRNNAAYAADFRLGDLPAVPAKKVAVLACMDARIDVHKVLGLVEGDAHVIRNAGGLVTDDAMRSLLISQRFLGTEEIILIQHTGCGLLGIDEAEARRQITQDVGAELPFELGSIDDLDSSVRDAVTRLERSPFISARTVRGFVYEVETGRLRELG